MNKLEDDLTGFGRFFVKKYRDGVEFAKKKFSTKTDKLDKESYIIGFADCYVDIYMLLIKSERDDMFMEELSNFCRRWNVFSKKEHQGFNEKAMNDDEIAPIYIEAKKMIREGKGDGKITERTERLEDFLEMGVPEVIIKKEVELIKRAIEEVKGRRIE